MGNLTPFCMCLSVDYIYAEYSVTEEHSTGENTERLYKTAILDFNFREGIDKMEDGIQMILVVSFISYIRNCLTYYRISYSL
jgi:hypothetical protein